ncbi:hypothetical protein NIES4072_07820 [Nostoc commune NIES-4072]|uniref:ATPase involved in DNA repair n=1 Tax=Nostoc commune NIES-4072 TaxID=2005467 RepID=A0A2R5FLL4_NOSCO|nr:hypothetical protein [Nostoc commune]BBD65543.1 hypothetical protein NIES4070_19010 [Nostoc commune HK-02]GBG17133.1 hypothetical protein NIES4072_07820 [Nostoc commune NIES-4072]
MSRQKRTSRILEKVELRASGMKSIVPSIKFEQDYTLEKLIESIEQLRNKLDVHNSALAIVDSTLTEVEEMEKKLKQLSEKMLMVVAIKFGKDSAEYEMAGGVRNSDRIRKMRASRLKNVADQASDKNGKPA